MDPKNHNPHIRDPLNYYLWIIKLSEILEFLRFWFMKSEQNTSVRLLWIQLKLLIVSKKWDIEIPKETSKLKTNYYSLPLVNRVPRGRPHFGCHVHVRRHPPAQGDHRQPGSKRGPHGFLAQEGHNNASKIRTHCQDGCRNGGQGCRRNCIWKR